MERTLAPRHRRPDSPMEHAMTDRESTTDASKIELTEMELDRATGGAVDMFIKIKGVAGGSEDSSAEMTRSLGRSATNAFKF